MPPARSGYLALLVLFALLLGPSQGWARGEVPLTSLVKPGGAIPRLLLPAPPAKMTLCGEPVPLHKQFVREQFAREFVISVHDQAQVVMWLKRAARYFPYIEARLKQAGMPDDLKYVAVAESSLLRHIRSHAGARGLWQFISRTGRRYGLRNNRYFDDRRNLERSTGAAIAYLKKLYEMFKSWPLAMAAYNCGESRVRREMAEQGESDYYDLYLPNETMRYVFRILAIKAVLSDPDKYGYHLPPARLYRPTKSEPITLNLHRPMHIRLLAKAAGTTFRRIKHLNPELRGYYLPRGANTYRLPPGTAQRAAAKLKDVKLRPLPKRLAFAARPKPDDAKRYTVRSGDTLAYIAHRHGVKIKDLRRANGIRGSFIKPGQRLIIPHK